MTDHTLTPHVRTYVQGRWRRGEIGPGARTAYGYTLHGFAASHGRRPLSHLNAAAIDRWLETTTHLAPNTRRHRLSMVRGFCRWLVEQGKLRLDPTLHIPAIRVPRREPVTLTDDEVTRLVAALPDDRARVIVGMMWGVGARCCEVARWRVEDYDRAERAALLWGKGDHQRIVVLPKDLAVVVDRHLAAQRISHGPVLRSRNDPSSGLSPATLTHYVRDWAYEAGVKRHAFDGRGAHALRRTALSDFMEATNGDIRVVQAIAGHQSMATTEKHYLRWASLGQMRAAVEARESRTSGGEVVALPVPGVPQEPPDEQAA